MLKPVIFLIAVLGSSSALAVNIHEFLGKAYDNSDRIKATRDQFLNDIETFPQALADFLPDISVRASSSDSTTKYKLPIQQAPTKQKTTQKSLNINQSIFSGGSGIAGLKAAQSAFRAGRGNFYDKEQQGILEAIQTYLNCYAAKEKYKISESSVNYNTKQVEAAWARLELGEATKSDVANAKAALAIAESNRLNAYSNWQTTKAQFVKIFGITPENINLPPEVAGLPKSLNELSVKSLELNPVIENARHYLAAIKAQEFAAKAFLSPQVDLNIKTGNTYYDRQTTFNNNLNNFSTSSTISVTMPIYYKGGKAYSNIRQAKNKTGLAVINLDDAIKTNNTNCVTVWEQYEAAKSSMESARQGIEAAEMAYEGITEEELLGSKTILDILNAEEQLSKAKSQKVDADTQYILSAYQIKALLGQVTAKALRLKVKYFSPEDEFKKIKRKIISF